MKFYGEALGQNFMMEEFYDEILKACGAIPSIYFSPIPAASAITANGTIKFHRDSMHARQCAR